MRSIDSVVLDIKNKLEILKTSWFLVVDNEFTVNRERTRQLLQRLIREFGGKLQLMVFARIDIAKDEELLKLMKKAGVYRIYLGIESINNRSLNIYRKRQTFEDTVKSIETIYANGLEIFASLVLGSDEDTRETISGTFDFLIKYRVHAICMLSIYDFPTKERVLGIPQVFPDNRFIHRDWRFYNGNFVIHYPRLMKPSTLQREMMDGTYRFYTIARRCRDFLCRRNIGYIIQYWSLKPVLKTMERYIKVLERYELGMYDSNEKLIEERLPKDDLHNGATYLSI